MQPWKTTSELTTPSPTLATMLLLLCLVLSMGHIQGTAISPQTMVDATGNSADEHSNITWGPLPAGKSYALRHWKAGERGLPGLSSMVQGFVGVLPPSKIPYDLINEAARGKLSEFMKDPSKIINAFLGIGICTIVGLLFTVAMPIVGGVFCCCRLCGKCGGRNTQKSGNVTNIPRIVWTVCLFVTSAMILFAAAFSIVSNDQTSRNINHIGPLVKESFHDLAVYFDNLIMQVNHTALTNYNFTANVIRRDLDNIGILVGEHVRDTFKANVSIPNVVATIGNLSVSLSTLSTLMTDINTKMAVLSTKVTTLHTELSTVKSQIEATKLLPTCLTQCSTIDTTPLVIDLDPSKLPSIANQTSKMAAAATQNLPALMSSAIANFDNLPASVTASAASAVTSTKASLDTLSTLLDGVLANVEITTSKLGQLNVGDQLGSASDVTGKYEKYRRLTGLGFATVLLLIASLQFAGLFIGLYAYNPGVPPHNRGMVSKSAGHMLMAAVGLNFIFSWVLMLPTTLTFMLGGTLEKYLCSPLRDPNYEIFKQTIDKENGFLGYNGYYLGGVILSDWNINLTVHGILDGCKKNGAAYNVLKLKNIVNLQETTDYKTQTSIQTQLNTLATDLASVNIMTPTLKTALENFRDALNLPYDTYINEIKKEPVKSSDLKAYGNNVLAIGNMNNNPAKSQLKQEGWKVKRIRYTEALDVKKAKNDLRTSITAMKKAAPGVIADINTTLSTLDSSNILNERLDWYNKRILTVLDQFVDKLLNSMEHEVGVCTPIWNLYDSVVSVTLCRYVAESLNIFWFCLGWALAFFIPSIVCSVRLAKYLRPALPDGQDARRVPTPSTIRKNKVTPGYPHKPIHDNWMELELPKKKSV